MTARDKKRGYSSSAHPTRQPHAIGTHSIAFPGTRRMREPPLLRGAATGPRRRSGHDAAAERTSSTRQLSWTETRLPDTLALHGIVLAEPASTWTSPRLTRLRGGSTHLKGLCRCAHGTHDRAPLTRTSDPTPEGGACAVHSGSGEHRRHCFFRRRFNPRFPSCPGGSKAPTALHFS